MISISDIKRLIDNDSTSERKKFARIGRRYYEGQHDILNYKLYYYNGNGELVEDKIRSNIKICHPFFTELVDQCVQYILSGDDSFVRSDDPELQKELDRYFSDSFRAELSDALTDCCANGFGYMYAYKNAQNRTAFEYADAMGVVEVRAKDTSDKTEYVIYWYIDRIDKGKKQVKRIQVWDDSQVTYYVQVDSGTGSGKIVLDEEEPVNPRPHVTYEVPDEEEGTYGDRLGYIPFIRMDANRKQSSHLAPVKDLIDDYDLMACGLSNNLQDVSDALYVIKGYEGNNLDELVQNIRTKKHIGVDSDGDVDIKTIDLPYEARLKKLELDEKNIYHFGMGFNPTQVGDGNITNIVIKARYTLLDMKCNKMMNRLRDFLGKLVKIALEEINEVNGTAYSAEDIYYLFEREVMTNATDNAQIELIEAQTKAAKVNLLLSLETLFGSDTVIQEVCKVLDLDYEEIKDNLPSQEDELAAAYSDADAISVEDAV